jgi:hypothetical protein
MDYDTDDEIKVYWLCGRTFPELLNAVNDIWNNYPDTHTFIIKAGEPLMRGPHIEVNFTKRIIYVCI